MSYWYNAGTVSATNGSTTITGSGTAFVANLRVGDGFLAPDGRLYLIQSIASDTQLSIARNYIGSNVSGSADWWGVPVQGYVRDLADRVQQLISEASNVLDVTNTYGNVVTRDTGTGANQVPTTVQADARYLGKAAKAADSDKLDGHDSGYFLAASAKAADADKLD
ncbi:hypothetical protein GWK93_00555, partial [Vibrio parahaemolyticus]|uniref:hypothetical protein n=1 Tax=Vibrio parahaemolyticus TaxID=670 RepID=UPI00192A1863